MVQASALASPAVAADTAVSVARLVALVAAAMVAKSMVMEADLADRIPSSAFKARNGGEMTLRNTTPARPMRVHLQEDRPPQQAQVARKEKAGRRRRHR